MAPGASGSVQENDEALEPNLAVPLEVLERNLTSHAAHIAAAEAQWLGWLGEYCVREGWGEWGCSGPVQWLSWQCGMSPSTARDKVRVSLALRELPMIRKRHAQGRLSYSKVRAVTRVATPESDAELAQLALAATGAQLDLIVRSYKKALDADKAARSAWANRSWRSRSDGDESTVFTLRVPNHDADVVIAAIRAEVNETIGDALGTDMARSRNDIVESRGGWPAMKADAAVALLNGTARTNDLVLTDVEVVVGCDHGGGDTTTEDSCAASAEAAQCVDEPNTFLADSRSVATAVGHRLCCDPRIAALVEDSRGSVLGSSRQTRLVSRKLRRALERRDRAQCQFPGCAAHRRLHAHHIIHWALGGPTELDNLILVCSFHHHVLHEGGWRIDPATYAFIRPDSEVPHPCPSERFRGNVAVVGAIGSFRGPAPLAEAENEPFDLGLVLESLAYDDSQWRSRLEYGPPVPANLARQRIVQAHWARNN